MTRTKKNRLVQMAPHFDGFKPLGIQSNKGPDIYIKLEEYEALKLCDYELLTQAEAAKMMNISRPTLTRIYESARRKIVTACVEGCLIRFEGGNVNFASWYKCEACKITFSIPENAGRICPLCKKERITENE